MKIIIPGGSGQVGRMLARWFQARGDEVVILSRNATDCGSRTILWDAKSLGPWVCEIDGADVVINLAGRNVNCRYSDTNRREIVASRVDSTRIVGEAIAQARRPPQVWLQAGTATIYAHRFDAANDEMTGRLGGTGPGEPDTWRFSLEVAYAWEAALEKALTPRTRKVALRSAMTMSADRGGVFDVLLSLVRRGLGGRAGNGRQFISWIHELDFVRAVDWLIANNTFTGPANLAAPEPLPNAEFMQGLREAWGIRFGLPANRLMLELGAFVLRTETELILKSRRVVPGRLLAGGFDFKFPAWPGAARDLCAQWRQG